MRVLCVHACPLPVCVFAWVFHSAAVGRVCVWYWVKLRTAALGIQCYSCRSTQKQSSGKSRWAFHVKNKKIKKSWHLYKGGLIFSGRGHCFSFLFLCSCISLAFKCFLLSTSHPLTSILNSFSSLLPYIHWWMLIMNMAKILYQGQRMYKNQNAINTFL